MELKINVTEENYEKVKQVIDLLFSPNDVKSLPVQAVEVQAEPKKKQRKKPKIEEVNYEEGDEEQQAYEQTEEQEVDVDIDQIRALVSKLAKDYRDEIKSKLTELGANNVTSLDSADYAEFMEFLQELS